jgi:hypothetical protein
MSLPDCCVDASIFNAVTTFGQLIFTSISKTDFEELTKRVVEDNILTRGFKQIHHPEGFLHRGQEGADIYSHIP